MKAEHSSHSTHDTFKECDFLIVGSGAAGLSAATTAAFHGLNVIVAEKSNVVGGTTAWSGGWIWAPCNHIAYENDIKETPTHVAEYLKAVVGDKFNEQRVMSFLNHAPHMVSFFNEHTQLQFDGGLTIPDTYSQQPNAGTGGRSVIAKPFDGRQLGDKLSILRKPAKETTFHGMTIQAGPDLRAFMNMTRSLSNFAYATKRVMKHTWDLVRYQRGMSMRNGLALAARLLASATQLGVTIQTQYNLISLIEEEGTVTGAVFDTPTGRQTIFAKKGVVLATGGFAHDTARRQAMFRDQEDHLTLAVPEATGGGLTAAEAIGAQVETDYPHAGAWCPVSFVPYRHQAAGQFPHIIERGKPGIIGVLKNGKRFCNEGLGYHDYVTNMYQATPEGTTLESWLICDHTFQRRYGLGIARPTPVPTWGVIRSGYLTKANTIEELASKTGIDPSGLHETINNWNQHAAHGDDPEFHRGSTKYTRYQGDPTRNLSNPCVAPISKPPFYAVRVQAGSFGTFAGLKTNEHAQVLNEGNQPIPGLYAAGCDLASIMGGQYPAGGINLGPALTFGYIAARHAAEVKEWETSWRFEKEDE
ncbi:FAD-dependent oxidoreductase [Vibrio sp. FJH11]